MFDLLVTVVGENLSQNRIAAQGDPLVVPVNGFDLFLQTRERAMFITSRCVQ
jgi:hypothetical protein